MVIVLKKALPQLQKTAEVGCTTAVEIANLIDEIGAMLPDVEAKQKKIKALQKELQPYADKMKALIALVSAIQGPSADETFQREGMVSAAMVGRRCVVRTVTNPALAIKLLNKVEAGVAWKVIAVPLGKLDLFLTPAEKDQVLTIDRGERPVTVIKKAAEGDKVEEKI